MRADAVAEINNAMAWLMDPVASPTKCNTLLTIRNQNPFYGSPEVLACCRSSREMCASRAQVLAPSTHTPPKH
eukprot:471073-Prymnesium_polylepis.1